MSDSTKKHPFTVIGIHPVPAHLSIPEFVEKIETLADTHLALPVGQNFQKYDLVRCFKFLRFSYSHQEGRYFPTISWTATSKG
jgi:hypothetical protein